MVFLQYNMNCSRGQILEDIDLYNRVHDMFNNFTAEGSRYADYSEGFGNIWD